MGDPRKGAYVIIPKFRPRLEMPHTEEMREGLRIGSCIVSTRCGLRETKRDVQNCERAPIRDACSDAVIEQISNIKDRLQQEIINGTGDSPQSPDTPLFSDTRHHPCTATD
jgi:hypothetical protein